MYKSISRLLIAFIFAVPFLAFAFSVPDRPTGFVQDYASLLSTEEVATLETKLENFEKNTTNEIAVVTIPSLDGDTIENVAQEIFTDWGIGKADTDNGVLLLISLSDRKTRIHTGYGVEGALTDIGTSYIQSDIMTPAFRNEDYYAGIDGAVDKMIEALGGNEIVPEGYNTDATNSKVPWNFILIFAFIILQILASILAQSKSWWGGGVLGGGVALAIWHFFISSAVIAVPLILLFIGGGLFFDFIVSRAYTKKRTSGRYPWWFGGGGGFGGSGGSSSSGGFGGFSGGSSGGGGSSGSW